MQGLKSLYGLKIDDTVFSKYGWYGRVVYIDEGQFRVYVPSCKSTKMFIWSDLIGVYSFGGHIAKIS